MTPAETMSDPMRVVYIAAPLSAPTPEGIEANRHRAALWAAWALTEYDVSPVCSWIVLTGILPETPANRKLGLAADKAQVALCDECWLVGGRVSSGMAEEASVAKKVVDLTHLGEWPPGYEHESVVDPLSPAVIAEVIPPEEGEEMAKFNGVRLAARRSRKAQALEVEVSVADTACANIRLDDSSSSEVEAADVLVLKLKDDGTTMVRDSNLGKYTKEKSLLYKYVPSKGDQPGDPEVLAAVTRMLKARTKTMDRALQRPRPGYPHATGTTARAWHSGYVAAMRDALKMIESREGAYPMTMLAWHE